MVSSNIEPILEKAQTFGKAWNYPNKESHRKWCEETCKEFTNMNKEKVWQKTVKSLMPPNHWCITNMWGFKIKHDGVYWVHLVACGTARYPVSTFPKASLWQLMISPFASYF